MGIIRTVGTTAGILSLTAVGLAGCSSNSDPEPTTSPTSASASPTTAAPTTPTSNATTFKLDDGNVKVAGAGKWVVEGGTMTFTPSGSGPTAGTVEAAGQGNASTGDFNLRLEINENGNVTSGTFTAPGRDYKVTDKTGTVNFLSTGDGTTLVTENFIPVQMGTETPTTMTLKLQGEREA